MSVAAAGLATNLDETVVQVTAELSAAAFTDRLRAIVLTGSLARGEGTWVPGDRRMKLAGDVEFLLVFGDRGNLPPMDSVAKLTAAIETRLSARGLDVHAGLSPVKPGFLRGLQPHIFAYELIAHGRVIWGKSDILTLAPAFRAAEIPLEDGFRLLSNRIVELLELLCGIPEGAPLTDAAGYRALKLCLDMATSFLLFEGRYEPGYRARANRLKELAAAPVHCPVLLDRFAERVAAATQCKLDPSRGGFCRESASLIRLIEDARLLWRWELERLTGGGAGTHDRELLRRWMRSQPLAPRLRGWASAARRLGARRSFDLLPDWFAQIRGASPRHLVYAAAGELFFALPDLLYRTGYLAGRATRWNELQRALPVPCVPGEPCNDHAWRKLGRAIAWNYHELLEFTRA